MNRCEAIMLSIMVCEIVHLLESKTLLVVHLPPPPHFSFHLTPLSPHSHCYETPQRGERGKWSVSKWGCECGKGTRALGDAYWAVAPVLAGGAWGLWGVGPQKPEGTQIDMLYLHSWASVITVMHIIIPS